MSGLLPEQYDLVRKTRETLFTFFESIPANVLHADVPGFGGGTIARTHLHAAGCYMHWLGGFAQIRSNPEFPTEEEIRSADGAVLLHVKTYTHLTRPSSKNSRPCRNYWHIRTLPASVQYTNNQARE